MRKRLAIYRTLRRIDLPSGDRLPRVDCARLALDAPGGEALNRCLNFARQQAWMFRAYRVLAVVAEREDLARGLLAHNDHEARFDYFKRCCANLGYPEVPA
jgi:hypothetical protein